jgi:hypothetical protein
MTRDHPHLQAQTQTHIQNPPISPREQNNQQHATPAPPHYDAHQQTQVQPPPQPQPQHQHQPQTQSHNQTQQQIQNQLATQLLLEKKVQIQAPPPSSSAGRSSPGPGQSQIGGTKWLANIKNIVNPKAGASSLNVVQKGKDILLFTFVLFLFCLFLLTSY